MLDTVLLALFVVMIIPVALWGSLSDSRYYRVISVGIWMVFMVATMFVSYQFMHEISGALRRSLYYGILSVFSLIMARVNKIKR